MARRVAIIMAGGGGTRLWPIAGDERPKPLIRGLPRAGETLLAATIARARRLVRAQDIFVVTTAAQAPRVAEAIPSLPSANLIAEPCGRNTSACVALALLHLRAAASAEDEPTTVLVLPADHHVADAEGFADLLGVACDTAERLGAIVTLGIEPTRADTGYGYIEHGGVRGREVRTGRPIPLPVARFVEKPDAETAARYLASGRHLWNAGIFVATAARLEAEYRRHSPRLWSSLEAAVAGDADALALAYEALPSVPIDVDLIEKQADLRVVPAEVGWSDLGTWESIAAILPADAAGNAVVDASARTVLLDSRDCLVWNEGGTIAAIGLEGVAIISTGSRTLVCPIERAQEVRALVDELERRAGADAKAPDGPKRPP